MTDNEKQVRKSLDNKNAAKQEQEVTETGKCDQSLADYCTVVQHSELE